MSVLEVLQDCQRNGIKLTVRQGKLLADDPSGALTGELRARLAAHKPEIISWLIERSSSRDGVSAQPARGHYPLSFAQQQLWLIDQLQGGSPEYNVPAAFELNGTLNRAAMQAALDQIVERHAVLRTVFRLENEEPVQVIQPAGPVPVEVVDLGAMAAEEQKAALDRMIQEESARPFDLTSGLMLRCTLIRLRDDGHVVLFTMHHIACDGWSRAVLVKEFVGAYEAACNGTQPVLPALPVQYCDYAIWQRESVQDGVLAADVAYWQQRLAGIPVVHGLPLDGPRPAVQRFEAERHVQRIDKALLTELQQLGAAHQASLFMVLQSAFALLLSRYSGESDVVIGVPNGGRARRELEPLIGYFINTQVLRTEVDEQQTVGELLTQARIDTLEAFAHNNVPFDHLVDVLKHPRSLAYNPLCQVKFVLQNYEPGELKLSGLHLKSLGRAEERIHFDLDLTVIEAAEELRVGWSYKSGLFQQGSIVRMAETFHRLLQQMVAQPDAKLEALTGLAAADRRALQEAGTGPARAEGRDELLPRAIAQQAARTPDAIALRSGDVALSYRELESRTNRLAQVLAEQGIERGSRVGVHLGRSIELLIAQIAIMKTGAAYVPLDPKQQGERLAAMVRDAEIAVVLLDSRTMRLPVLGVDTVFVDGAATESDWLSDYPDAAPEVDVRAGDTIYVLYTSGSTGEPKGVEVHHGGVIDYCAFARGNYYGDQLQGSLVATSPAFDLTLPALYVPLLAGGCVELLPEQDELEALSRWLSDDNAAVLLRLTPSHVQALLTLSDSASRHAAHVFVIGGEVFEPALARSLQAKFPAGRIINHYGPTETVVGCSWFDVTANLDALDARIPIGKPMENTSLYVLDGNGRMQPAGVPGELSIGGAGVAKGYLNRPELTAGKFVAGPFGEGRVYRSGDRVRWTADGQLEFLSRVDRQVKLRGYRIELGEIESRLKQSAHVREAVVRLWGEAEAAQLVAYVVAADAAGDREATQAALHAELSAHLPAYMLPAAYVWLDLLPLTVNGKVDVQALPAPDTSALRTREYEAPQGEIEETLSGLWQTLLRVERAGRHDNFFELGGHSLLAVQLISRIRATMNVELPLRALFAAPTLSGLAEAVREAAASTMGRILPADRSQPLPLSLAQQRLWFLDQLDKAASAAYHMPAALRLLGRLDVEALQATLDRLVARHESLRTRFVAVDGVPYQQIAPEDCGFALHHEDLSGLSAEKREAAVAALAAEEARASFDLSDGPLIRGRLLDLGGDEHVLLVTMHHIVSDGWSLGILVREVAALYTAFSRGETDPLPPLEIQYADYAQWQRGWLQGEELTRQFDFWKSHLSGAPELLNLPLDRPRPAVQSHAGGSVPLVLSRDLTDELRAFSQRHGVTLFMTLLSGWGLLLSRLSGQQDVVIGTPVANRQRREVENLIGFFVNTLPLRLRFDAQPSVASLLAQVQETTLAAFAHQELPFEQVVEAVQPVRSLSHTPLFQTMLSLNNTNTSGEGALELPGLTLARVAREQNSTQFDLSLVVSDKGDRLEAALGYGSALFDRATVERWAGHFVRLLETMVADASAAVDTLPILSDAERRQVLVDLNATEAAYPQDTLIHGLFEQQAAAHPDAVAVVFEDQSLTYGELNAQANRLAHELIAVGVRPDDRVAICAERGLEMVVGLLAILKAGGAYVPLDPAYPIERLQYMVQDGAPKALLTQQPLQHQLPLSDVPVLLLDSEDLRERLSTRPASNPDPRALGLTPRHLAYVIYTSGSTGLPKGVAIEHANTANLLHWALANFTAEELSNSLFATSINFDLAVYELFAPLAAGATLTLVPNALALTTRPEPVTLINTVPSAIKALLDAGGVPARTQLVNLAGEPLKRELAERIFAETAAEHVANLYGPSETTTYSTWVRMSRAEGFVPHIGRPVANTQVYILDARREPVPLGVAGEIYIGGAGVARGYLNRPELTAERFLRDPFRADANARMYKTGDLGRWLPDGNIEYLGRNDFQVKIRGFRIELGEIETKLSQYANVREAVVVAREDVPGDKRLVAYVLADQDVPLQASELRTALLAQLPEYMVPSAFVQLEAMPRTSNGKLDRNALPAPETTALITCEYEAPQGEIEETLAAIWQELLHVERVGRHDNFFDLGGHSLLAVQLVSRLRAALDVELPLRALFAAPSLSVQAEAVRDAGASTMERIERADRSQPLPLSLAQQRLWFVDQLDKAASAAFHMPVAMRLLGKLDADALQATLDRVVARHEGLRTSFVTIDGVPYQQMAAEDCGFALRREDLSHLPADEREAVVARLTAEEAREPFDLSTGPLIRGRLLQVAGEEHVLLVTQHHIITDGWSLGILVREVAALYTAFSRGEADPLQPLEIQYADYAQWQRQWLQGDELTRQFDFWKNHLTGAPALLSLPLDRPRPAVQNHAGASVPLTLSAELTAGLYALSQRHGATMFMTLLSAWGLLLSRLSGQQDVVVETPVANRQRREVEELIGFFVNTLALRLRFDEQPSVSSLLEQVRETTLAAFAHQELPFEQVVEALQPRRSLSHNPIAQASFTWYNQPSAGELALPELRLAMMETGFESTQADLSLHLAERDGVLKGKCVFASTLFDRTTIERWAGYFVQLLEMMVADPSVAVDSLPLLSDAERRQVLHDFNATDVAYRNDKFIHELFEEHAAARPDAVAVVFEGESLTYSELNTRANQLAHYLIDLGVQPDDRVAICAERGVELVVGLLGVLKAGGAYLPLDPAYPSDRLQYMLEDGAPKALLTQSDLEEQLPVSDVPVLRLDVDLPILARRLPSHNPDARLTSNNLAYVIYTSGSTGLPKGVMVEHGGLSNLAYAQSALFGVDAQSRVLQFASIAFDASVSELAMTLTRGACLCLVSRPALLPGEPLQTTLRELAITHVTLPAAAAVSCDPADFPALQCLIVAGDVCPPALTQRWHDQLRFFNAYGPTETTVCASAQLCEAAHQDTVPIGRPIANMRMYILDGRGEPVPVGVEGEIYIGGKGVARGYLNRPELTAERFSSDPFRTEPEARMYKTGDRGRWLPDGTIEYLGRHDFQVKIRGFRIELGEIEAKLVACAGVHEAAVTAREDVPGDKRLVAYVVAEEEVTLQVAELRAALSTQLPDYMLPSAFVTLEALPLTVNGKLDRKALPAPEASAVITREYEPPQGEVETAVAALWQELLNVPRVGRHDQFFELGGHSLLVVAMVERLRAQGLSGAVQALFASPTLCDYAATLQRDAASGGTDIPSNPLTPETTVITPDLLPLVTLTQTEIDRIVAAVPGGVANIQDIYPLLPLQEGMLFHHLLETKSDIYLGRNLIAFDHKERLDGFLTVLQQLIARHDMLRTAVSWEGLSRPVQVVFREAPLSVEVVTLSGERDAVEEMRERTDPHQMRLDLRRAPLLAAYVAEDAQRGQWLLSLLSHHMVFDHETLELVMADVRALLRGEGQQLATPLPLRNLVAQTSQVPPSVHEAYFREQLADIDEPTAPFGVLNVQVKSTDTETVGMRLDDDFGRRLRDCAGQLGVPPSVLFHVAWAQVLARCTGRSEVVFGTVLSGRLQGTAGADRALGMFINTLPLRVSLESDARQVVQQSYERMVSLLAHEQAPLVLAQRSSGVPLQFPLFTTLLNYRHGADATATETAEMEGIRLVSVHEAVNYPILASVDDFGHRFSLKVQCLRVLEAGRVMRYLSTALDTLVSALETETPQPLRQLDILPADDRATLLYGFNDTHAEYPADTLIHELFEQQAAVRPDAVAVVVAEQSLTYAELNARANQLAHELIDLGVQPDDRVAICVERGLEMVVGLLGILKAGGAYLPMDPAYPAERLQYLLHDGAPRVLLTQESVREQLPAAEVPSLLLDSEELRARLSTRPASNPSPRDLDLTARNLAYVIYTSGSTGLPKGVAIEHANTANLLHWALAHFTADELSNSLFSTSINFDLAVYELFVPLAAGSTLTLVPNALALTARPEPVTLINTVPSAIKALLDAGGVPAGTRLVNLAGEPLKRELAERIFAETAAEHVANLYGPSETTTYSTWVRMSREDGFAAHIGRPIANTQVYILDAHGEPVPMGVAGEIYIGGAGVARGYLNRPELTAERFLRDPFSADANARMYKTGDVGRWLAGGNIEYLGRNDFQVKIRGFRIELGEIEAKLSQCAGVREAVVIAREEAGGDKRLIAYLVIEDGVAPHASELRAALLAHLPEYMVPSAFVALEALPLTANGKLDRKALPAPDAVALAAREYEAPQGEIETALAAIWQNLLKLPRVGRHDHFFELGGHSLTAVTLSVHVEEQLHVALPLKTIFQTPRLLELAQSIAQAQQSLISEQEVAAMQSELDSLSDEELLAFLGDTVRG